MMTKTYKQALLQGQHALTDPLDGFVEVLRDSFVLEK